MKYLSDLTNITLFHFIHFFAHSDDSHGSFLFSMILAAPNFISGFKNPFNLKEKDLNNKALS